MIPIEILSSFLSGTVGVFIGWFLTRSSGGKCLSALAPNKIKSFKGKTKLVLIVRTDLNMSKGKIAAQCSHATLGCYKSAQKFNPSLLKYWEHQGQPKIVLRASSLEELESLSDKAEEFGLINYFIQDAGHTQVAEGTVTVLGIGPGLEDEIDKVSGHLKLL